MRAAEHVDVEEGEYMKLWKALFYCVWHADKVPVQQALIHSTAALVRSASSRQVQATRFIAAFFKIIQREWMGLDHLRLDKFMTLVRRMVHETLRCALKADTPAAYTNILHDILNNASNGLRFHVMDVYVDELATAAPDASTEQLQNLLAPIYAQCVMTNHKLVFEHVPKDVLRPLLQRIMEVHGKEASFIHEPEVAAAAAAVAGLTPLAIDHAERAAALERAFKKVSLVPLAKDLFAIASYAYVCKPAALCSARARARARVGARALVCAAGAPMHARTPSPLHCFVHDLQRHARRTSQGAVRCAD
ncbi:MAG: hypothetical protein EOO41_01135 [Methanobacteriota archaeon]|nr:MAG: hypothetical protein EOO41_01135 [Euryarchaeota archaeon]